MSGRQRLRDLRLKELHLFGQLLDGLVMSRHFRLDRRELKRQFSYFLLLTLDNGMGRIQLIQ